MRCSCAPITTPPRATTTPRALWVPSGVHLDMDPGDAVLLDSRLMRRENANTAYDAFPWMVERRRRVTLRASFVARERLLGDR